jgi:hypothetical protein
MLSEKKTLTGEKKLTHGEQQKQDRLKRADGLYQPS